MSRFDWDPRKAHGNARTHGVSFDEAETVADDPLHQTGPDPRHASDEDRFVTVGHSEKGRLLIVIVSERGPRPRIISGAPDTRRISARGYRSRHGAMATD